MAKKKLNPREKFFKSLEMDRKYQHLFMPRKERELNQKRESFHVSFNDGLSADKLSELAEAVYHHFKRFESIMINEALVLCTVRSQSGLSTWKFSINYNNWGHITGRYWMWSENDLSDFPEYYAKALSSKIQDYYTENKIELDDYDSLINKELTVIDNVLEYEPVTIWEKVFSYIKGFIVLKNDLSCLLHEHLYYVIAKLRSLGFINIDVVAIKDTGYFAYECEEIWINNHHVFQKGDIFSAMPRCESNSI